MTKLVVHPAITAARYTGSPVLLRPPWSWWQTRAHRHDEYGGLMLQTYNGDIDHVQAADDVVSVTFGRDWDSVVLTDPPSLRVITVEEYDDLAWGDPLRTARTAPHLHADVRVVWYERPGPDWYPVSDTPFPTCRPGDYRMDYRAGDRHDLRRLADEERHADDDARLVWCDQRQELIWPMRPTIRDGQPQPLPPLAEVLRYAFQPIPYGAGGSGGGGAYGAGMSGHHIPYPSHPFPMRGGGGVRTGVGAGGSGGGGGGGRRSVTVPRRNPEQQVVDQIEELIADGLQVQAEPSGYEHNINQEHCPVCGRGWHGLPGVGGSDGMGNEFGARGCPGAFADGDEIAAWRTRHGH